MGEPSLCSSTGLRLFALAWILTTITNFPAAFTHTSVNSAVHKINEYLNESFTERYRPLENHEVSLIKSGINSVWYVGQVAGAMISPYICDNWGRKPAYIISIVMMTAACGLQMLASLTPFPEVLITGRIITAVFSPLSDAALILYLQEVSPSSLRGTMSSLFSTGYAVMCLFGMLLGHENILDQIGTMLSGHSLSMLLFVPVIPGILSIVFMYFVPETPKFLLITRKDKISALASLEFFQGRRDEQMQLLEGLQQEGKTSDTERPTGVAKILYTTHLRRAFALSVAVLILTLPFYPILQSSTHFFTHLDIPNNIAQLLSSLLMVLLTCSCIASTTMVDKLPRRFMLLSAGIACMLSLTIFVLAAELRWKYMAMASLFIFVFSYGMGISPVAWSISPELVPLPYRSAMFCLCYAVHSCLVVLTNFATIPIFGLIGAVCFVPIYIMPCSMALVYVYLYLPETKGQETSDIVNELMCSRKVAGKATDA